jgi:hypothetical protein
MAGGSVASMMKFASCMRSHGVSNFPDPNSQGAISISSSSGIDPNSAQYTKAQQSCQTLMPGGGAPSPAVQHKMQMQALAYSACMRAHGLPGFPDPSFSGGAISLRISRSGTGGIDPNSPQFQSAQEACQGKLPGKPLGAVRAAGTSVRTVGGASNGGG